MFTTTIKGIGKAYYSQNWKDMCERIYGYANACSGDNTPQKDIDKYYINKAILEGMISIEEGLKLYKVAGL